MYIKQLTKDQIDMMPAWVDKWTKIGLCTDPADFDTAIDAAMKIYDLCKLRRPQTVLRCQSPLETALIGATWSNVRSNVESNVWSNVEANVQSNVESNVWSNVRSNVESNVESNVRSNVEANVQSNVRSTVWSTVWSNVRSTVRSNVESNVEANVQSNVRSTVNIYRYYRGASLWASWYAYISYLRDCCGYTDSTLYNFGLDEVIAKSCGWTWWDNDVFLVSDRPLKINLENNLLHNETGLAIEYRDGWGLYALHNIQVPEWLITTPRHKLDIAKIVSIENVDQRREAIRLVGIEKCLSKLGWKKIEKTDMYELGSVIITNDQPRKYLKMKNPSVDAWHVEAVHPDCNSIQEAINYRAFGDKTKTWQPYQLT